MPTGYTAKLVESGQSFEEFVLTCARGFGACIDMRDEPGTLTVQVAHTQESAEAIFNIVHRFWENLPKQVLS